MKKYKTFGELLAFISEHLSECNEEDVHFAIVRVGGSGDKRFKSAMRTVNTIYMPYLINGLVVDVEQTEYDTHSNCVLIKVLV